MKWELLEDERAAETDGAVRVAPAALETPGRPLSPDSSRRDLELVEQLLDRCWREIDSSDLNIKLTDLVRLLEFKEKLRPAVEAQKTFWAIVDEMRREELAHFGEAPSAGTDASGITDNRPSASPDDPVGGLD